MAADSSQTLRDLRWAIASPSLLKPGSEEVATALWEEERLDPEHFAAHFAEPPSHRVGYYFESLIGYWLEHIRKVEMLANGLQIQDEERTLGELDFVFRDEGGSVIHWETAVKFYLYSPGEAALGSHFIGPNAGDTFERKTRRIFEHQLPLSQQHNDSEITIRQAFVKGRIFYPPDRSRSPELPPRLSEDHLRGTWIRAADVAWLASGEADFARILMKPYWLARERRGGELADVGTVAEVQETLNEHFSTRSEPVLLCLLRQEEDEFLETERVFVVGDAWPQTSKL